MSMVAILGQPNTKVFDTQAMVNAMRAYLPRCPEPHRSYVATIIRIQPWAKKQKLKTLIFATAHAYIRHQMTDYYAWIGRDGITRDEAYQIIKPELDEIFEYWCTNEVSQ